MAAELFLTPLIDAATKKAAGVLIKQFCQMRGMEENREKLHLNLLGIQEVLADAEKQGESNRFMEACLKKLHAAACEAVDVLDEFQYEALHQKAISQQPSSSAKAMKDFFSSENPILFRLKMSNKLTKTLGKIDEIFIKMKKFPLDRKPTIHQYDHSTDRETHSLVMESEVIGREGEREKIVNAVVDPQLEKCSISILPIVGMGGMGKTTLAQLVYNDESVKRHFQLLMWVCVSTEFNVVNIMKSTIQVTQNGVDVSTSNKEVLQQLMHKILNKKRYLLVLDDVWNEERTKWDELNTVLSSGAGAGSVVIVTTRSQKVASMMGTLPIYDLAKLTEEDSWKLFEKRAFGARVRKTEELIEVGGTIVRKCAGLPLAVKAMGGLMATKPDVCDWHAVAEHKLWEGLASSENILPPLKLSYDQLPSYMKQCFAFCAIFPQDYSIERDTLIQLWMANDFIPTEGTMDVEDKGRQIFNELCGRSFFQEIREEERDYVSIITCKMHDLMHDLATHVAGKKYYTQLELKNSEIAQEEVQHLVLPNESFQITILKQIPNIHTFLVGKLGHPKKYSYLLKSSSLRALRFTSHVSPPKELGYMRHLRYLDLSWSSFETFPDSVSKLYNLQTLNLSYTGIRELPEGMRYMTNLRHIFLIGSYNLKWMPIGLGQLKCLRTLTKYIVDPERGGSIEELKNLNDLCGHLLLGGLEKVRNRGDAEAANLAAKLNLHSLEFKWEPSRETSGDDQVVLEALRPHSKLKHLAISGFCGSSIPNWIKEPLIRENLKRLELATCINCAELPPLWQFPLLEVAHLSEMKNLKYFVTGTCTLADGSRPLITFPSLKELEVNDLSNLENWQERDFELVSFPNLTTLNIGCCPKLKTLPVHVPLLADLIISYCNEINLGQISNIPMLSHLDIIADNPAPTETGAFKPPKTLKDLRIMGFGNVNLLEVEENQSCQEHSLRTLAINNCNSFFSHGRSTKLVLGFWKHYFAAIQNLSIISCNDLVYWPEEELGSLKCLKKLYISSCNSFTGSMAVSSPATPWAEDSLPQLESLKILSCPELVEIPVYPTISLKELHIDYCHKLSREGLAGLTNLPSLERMWIGSCPKIESFPGGLQQRLPYLQYLGIWDCPALESRCRRGGEYCHLVQNIPRTFPEHTFPPNKNKRR